MAVRGDSVLRRLRHSGSMRRTVRLRALYRDIRRSCTLLDNLHFTPTAPSASERHAQQNPVCWYIVHMTKTARMLLEICPVWCCCLLPCSVAFTAPCASTRPGTLCPE